MAHRGRKMKTIEGQAGYGENCPICNHPDVSLINDMIMGVKRKPDGDTFSYPEIIEFSYTNETYRPKLWPSTLSTHKNKHIIEGIERGLAESKYMQELLKNYTDDKAVLGLLKSTMAQKALDLLMSVDEKDIEDMPITDRLDWVKALSGSALEIEKMIAPKQDVVLELYQQLVDQLKNNPDAKGQLEALFTATFPSRKTLPS